MTLKDLLYRLIPLLLSLLVSQIICLKVDKKYKASERIISKLQIKPKWKGLFFTGSAVLIVFIVGVLGIYAIDMPIMFYSIFCGALMGLGIAMAGNAA